MIPEYWYLSVEEAQDLYECGVNVEVSLGSGRYWICCKTEYHEISPQELVAFISGLKFLSIQKPLFRVQVE